MASQEKSLSELREGVREDFERWYVNHAGAMGFQITLQEVVDNRREDGNFGDGDDYTSYPYLNGCWEGFKGALGL